MHHTGRSTLADLESRTLRECGHDILLNRAHGFARGGIHHTAHNELELLRNGGTQDAEVTESPSPDGANNCRPTKLRGALGARFLTTRIVTALQKTTARYATFRFGDPSLGYPSFIATKATPSIRNLGNQRHPSQNSRNPTTPTTLAPSHQPQ
jgi:hypothetical protein